MLDSQIIRSKAIECAAMIFSTNHAFGEHHLFEFARKIEKYIIGEVDQDTINLMKKDGFDID